VGRLRRRGRVRGGLSSGSSGCFLSHYGGGGSRRARWNTYTPFGQRPTNRSRGRATTRRDAPVAYPSLPVAVGADLPAASNWLGLEWSAFEPLGHCTAENEPGVYRITDQETPVYLGQSKRLHARIKSHAKDARFAGCQISYHAMPQALDHQLLEREVDLIGAYYAATSKPPECQYCPQ